MLTTTLYRVNAAKQTVQEWTITAEEGKLYTAWGPKAGKLQHRTELVELNNSGRSLEEQTILEFTSKINKKQLQGYMDNLADAYANASKNMLGLPRPMLAKVYKPNSVVHPEMSYVQRKYDGNRCMIAMTDGELIAYSRRGKQLFLLEHILDGMHIPEGTVIDGEVYTHGKSLQTICSYLKMRQAGTLELKFHAYDLVSDEAFISRYSQLCDLHLGGNAEVAPIEAVNCAGEALEHVPLYRNEGYEGVMLRTGTAGYQCDVRSNTLLKMKAWHSAEYQVEGITTNQDGWAILLLSHHGKPFRATAPGPVSEKIEVGKNYAQYLDRYITITYAYITADGAPFQPTAVAWR